MRPNCGILAALLLGVMSAPASAQGRTITGSVRDSLTGAPIAGARIGLLGGTMAVSPNAAGQFELPGVPAGEVTLQVRAVGYRRQDVRVPAGVSTVEVALGRDVFKIEEIVVTGQATGVERRNLANAVATVSAEDIGAVPQMTASLEQVLQGKVAGVDIQSNGGAPGGGLQVRLRGVTSVNADAQPLYVVDGVVMSDVAIPSNQNAVTAAAGGSNPALTQDAQVNRIADLNPEDIESIEVLKGPSAAAIYGGRASNGVVIITTRRGTAVGGATQFAVQQSLGVGMLANTLGTRQFTAETAEATYGANGLALFNAANGQTFDYEDELYGNTSFLRSTQLSATGGNERTQFYASGHVKDD